MWIHLLFLGVALGSGGSGEFSDKVTSQFVANEEVSVVGQFPKSQIVSKHTAKPFLILVTQPWCGACKNLKGAISSGSTVQGLMKDFSVVHVDGDAGSAWREDGHGYVPQCYFYDSHGNPVDIKGPNAAYAHFFGDEQSLARAMEDVLKVQKQRDGVLETGSGLETQTKSDL